MTRSLAVAIVALTLISTVGCAQRSVTKPPARAAAAATYDPVSFAKVEALAAGQLKGANVELRGKFGGIYNNPYWAKRFPPEQWMQFSLLDEAAPDRGFGNVFIRQADAAALIETEKGAVVVVHGTLDHSGHFPFLTAVSAQVMK